MLTCIPHLGRVGPSPHHKSVAFAIQMAMEERARCASVRPGIVGGAADLAEGGERAVCINSVVADYLDVGDRRYMVAPGACRPRPARASPEVMGDALGTY